MIGLEQAEERPGRRRAGRQRRRPRTGSPRRRPRAGAARPADRVGVAHRRSSRYCGPNSCSASVAKPAAPSRQPCATHGCRPLPAPGSGGSSRPARSGHGGRRGGRCTARHRPRCPSGSRARPGRGPAPGSHRTPRPPRGCSLPRRATAIVCALGAARARRRGARRRWCPPRRSDRRWRRSSPWRAGQRPPRPPALARGCGGTGGRCHRRAASPAAD